VDVAVTGQDEDGEEVSATVTGRVVEVTGGSSPQLLINGNYFDYAAVVRVRDEK
jgi:hypothetical protein